MVSQIVRTLGATAARWFIEWEDGGSRGYPKSVTQVQSELAEVNPRFSELSHIEFENAVAMMWEIYHAVRTDGMAFDAALSVVGKRYRNV